MKKTLNLIVEQGHDFVIQVKGNRKALQSALQATIETQTALSEYQQDEKQKGRQEQRRYRVYDAKAARLPQSWHHIEQIIQVERKGIRKGRSYEETALDIASRNGTAEFFSTGIRRHWGIENELHREKDVQQNEDNNGIRTPNVALNVSLLQTTVINLFRLHGEPSLKYALEAYANRPLKSFNLINSTLCI